MKRQLVQYCKSASWPRSFGELEVSKYTCPRNWVPIFTSVRIKLWAFMQPELPKRVGQSSRIHWVLESDRKKWNHSYFCSSFSLLTWIIRMVINLMDNCTTLEVSLNVWSWERGQCLLSVDSALEYLFNADPWQGDWIPWPKPSRWLSQTVNKYTLRLQAG